MNARLSPAWTFCLWLTAFLLALPFVAYAQSEQPTPTPIDPLAGIPVQVLDQQQVTIGTHTITYNRIAPPIFPASSPTPTPQTESNTEGTKHSPQPQKVRRSAQTNDADEGQAKASKIVFLSATVYDHQFTELRWQGGTSPELTAFVNIDFNYFSGVDQIETTDTVYMLMFGLGNDTVDSLTQTGQTPPNLAAFPPGHSSYQIAAGDPNASPDAIAAIDALCAYYDANQAQMIAAYNQQEVDNAAHQQWLKDHPPVQSNTVINYWPIKSGVYLSSGH